MCALRRNTVTSLILKSVDGLPAYTSCQYVPTINCTARPGATYLHMFSTYYNRTSINNVRANSRRLCIVPKHMFPVSCSTASKNQHELHHEVVVFQLLSQPSTSCNVR